MGRNNKQTHNSLAKRSLKRKNAERKKAAAELVAKEGAKKASVLKYFPLVIAALLFFFCFPLSTSSTFLPLNAILIAAACGGILITLLLLLFRLIGKIELGAMRLLRYFLLGASVGYFLLVTVNYYGPHGPVETMHLPILDSHTRKAKRSRCKFSVATVSYKSAKLDIAFRCEDSELFLRSRMVELQVEKGTLGYYIYTDQKLIQ